MRILINTVGNDDFAVAVIRMQSVCRCRHQFVASFPQHEVGTVEIDIFRRIESERHSHRRIHIATLHIKITAIRGVDGIKLVHGISHRYRFPDFGALIISGPERQSEPVGRLVVRTVGNHLNLIPCGIITQHSVFIGNPISRSLVAHKFHIVAVLDFAPVITIIRQIKALVNENGDAARRIVRGDHRARHRRTRRIIEVDIVKMYILAFGQLDGFRPFRHHKFRSFFTRKIHAAESV